jgi:hypothetical protein
MFTIQNEWFLDTTSLADETDDDGMLVSVGVALRMMNQSGGGQCLYLPKVSVLNVIQFPLTEFIFVSPLAAAPFHFYAFIYSVSNYSTILEFVRRELPPIH